MTAVQGDRAAFVEWARRHAHPLEGLAQDLPAGDELAPFAAMVGDARIVGFGETWHLCHQFLEGRLRLARYLVEQLGFTVVLLEAVLPSYRRLDDFVQGADDDARAIVGSLNTGSRMWANEESVRFFEWLRAHNARATDKVRVVGVDLVPFVMGQLDAPTAPVDIVVDYLARVDPDWPVPDLAEVREVFAGLPWGNVTEPYGGSLGATMGYYRGLPESSRARLHSTFAEVVARLDLYAASYRHRSSLEELQWARRAAYAVLQGHALFEGNTPKEFRVTRAENMAGNAQRWLDDVGPGARALFLASTGHVGRGHWVMDSGDHAQQCGGYLAEWHGDDYVALTTTFGRGSFSPPHAQTGDVEVHPGDPESIDLALAEVGLQHFLLDVRGAASDLAPSWASSDRFLRVQSNDGWQQELNPAEAFDLFLFTEEIGSREALRR